MNRALPAPPPVMGYTGANPVRAVQAMTGGINRIGATPFQPLVSQPTPRVVAPPRPSAAEFNPLTNAGQFANPKTMVTFAPGAPPAPPLTQAGAGHQVGDVLNGPQVTAPQPNLASVPSPAANYTPPLPNLASALSAEAARMTAAPRVTSPIMTATPANASFADARSPLAGLTPSAKTTQASTAFGGTQAQTRTTPAFSAYSAADPNRALRTMRGY